MSKEKITREELQQELEKGKTVKQIAYDHGYSYPSRVLNDKMRGLGYRKNRTVSTGKKGAIQPYISPGDLAEAVKMHPELGLDRDEYNYFISPTSDGHLKIFLTKYEWRSENTSEVDE